MKPNAPKFLLTARINDFTIPPITDGLILGKNSPIGASALKKALNLLIPETFEHIEVDDDVISDILVKSVLVRRVSQARVVKFLMNRVRPFMVAEDILHIQVDAEITVSQEVE